MNHVWKITSSPLEAGPVGQWWPSAYSSPTGDRKYVMRRGDIWKAVLPADHLAPYWAPPAPPLHPFPSGTAARKEEEARKMAAKIMWESCAWWKTCSCPALTQAISSYQPTPSYQPSYLRESWFVCGDFLGTWTRIPPTRWITAVWWCERLAGNQWFLPTLCHLPHQVLQEPSCSPAAPLGTVGSQLTIRAEVSSSPFPQAETMTQAVKLCVHLESAPAY